MARVAANAFLLKGLRGHIGKEIVFKKYGNKTVVTRYPDMSNVKPSELQKKEQSRFARAVAYAQNINRNPALKAEYKTKVKKGQTVYHFAISEYLKNND